MEHFFKQLQHRRPGLFVGLRIVLEGIHPRLAGIRIGESVFDARIGDDLELRPRRLHLLSKGLHLLFRNKRIGCACEHENPSPDPARLRRTVRRERAVEADHRIQIGPGTRLVKDHRPAEAVSDGGDVVRRDVGSCLSSSSAA